MNQNAIDDERIRKHIEDHSVANSVNEVANRVNAEVAEIEKRIQHLEHDLGIARIDLQRMVEAGSALQAALSRLDGASETDPLPPKRHVVIKGNQIRRRRGVGDNCATDILKVLAKRNATLAELRAELNTRPKNTLSSTLYLLKKRKQVYQVGGKRSGAYALH